MDWLKVKSITINCDASFFEEYNKGIIAFVITDENSDIIYKKSNKITCTKSTEAEYLAIGMGVRWLNFYQKTNLIRSKIYVNIIGDSKSVIEYVKNPHQCKCTINKETLEKYNEEIKILKSNNKVSIKWDKRDNNKVADKLTRPKVLLAM